MEAVDGGVASETEEDVKRCADGEEAGSAGVETGGAGADSGDGPAGRTASGSVED